MKWTETNADLRRFFDLQAAIWDFHTRTDPMRIQLKDGREIIGSFNGGDSDHNGGVGGQWRCCGMARIKTPVGTVEEVDLLDIDFIQRPA